MYDLARQVVADAKGARHVYRIEVKGAPPPPRPKRPP